MFEAITWKQYGTAVIIAVLVYYAVIGVLYYRKQIRSNLAGRQDSPAGHVAEETPEDDRGQDIDPFEELEEIIDEIKERILEQAGKEISKDELLEQLSQRLDSYSGLRRPAYRIALNNFIIQHAESICGVTFSEEELDKRWRSLPRFV
ncbi:hypothetical protein [Pedobacter sp. GR22-10]|uniref:hypothetical protein n=1 Tax=Pedobacter sp. GR22-10 TaxID=2994472 RepID=UPI002246033B|nr:hypothetical protein [Pedobacter sp. GR22-10]MCX2429909.1 hypothetical protein [Pedobacter sp. GR22-10]